MLTPPTSRMRERSRSLLVAGLVALALAGCGSDTEASSAEDGGEREPVTARALALVAAEHAGTPDSAERERDAAEAFTSGGVGAELRYGSDGEYDGDSLVVAAGAGIDEAMGDCDAEAAELLAGCVRTDEGTLLWEAETPEEDPGVVYVVVDKGDSAALLSYAGPAITGDPRDLGMPIPTETLFAIANDPRVDVTSPTETGDAAADLPYWRAGG